MGNLATPNLPSREFDATTEFYAGLGFEQAYRDEGWLILTGHDVTVEFFLYPTLDPATSSFSCCLRLDDVDAFYETCRATGIPETDRGWPRLHPPRLEHSGVRIGYLVDLDGTLLRLVQNP